jgi:phosphopantothenate-cysteine ligase
MLSSITPETPPGNLAALAEDHYFGANPPPKDLEKHVAQARAFIDYHSAAGRRLVLVTSGGTTVPLGMSSLTPDAIPCTVLAAQPDTHA